MANGDELLGQLLVSSLKVPVSFTQQMMDKAAADAKVGLPHYEVNPNDYDSSQVRHFALTAAAITFLEAYGQRFAGTADIRLPNVLTSCSVTFEEGGEEGDFTETANTVTGSFSVSLSGSAQATAFSIPKLNAPIKETWSDGLPVEHVYLFSQSPSIATVLARAGNFMGVTVNAWPVFKPESVVITLIGQRAQSSAKVSLTNSSSTGGTVETEGAGDSYDLSPNIQIERIPPTLHEEFTLTGSSSVTKYATGSIDVGFDINAEAIATATSSVSPTTIAATTPAALPTSGLYAYRIDVEPNGEIPDYFFVHMIVFDFASIA